MTSSREEVCADGRAKVRLGDCRELLVDIETDTLGSIITDPPYELGFMSNSWDSSGIAYDIDVWKECYRALKPGHYLAAFSGTRTVHRMTAAIEDAGFQLLGMLYWSYGTGFPKSLNISKAIDKHLGKSGKVVGKNRAGKTGLMRKLRGDADKGEWGSRPESHTFDVIGPESEEAKHWYGWGTQLKPAYEPIVIAFKPAEGVEPLSFSTHRFAYVAKASTSERELGITSEKKVIKLPGKSTGYNPVTGEFTDGYSGERGNIHVTVKPLDIMRWLVDLLHPKGEVCLDPFMGSGSTGLGLLIEDPDAEFLGFDLTEDYLDVAIQRLNAWEGHYAAKEPLLAQRKEHGLTADQPGMDSFFD